MAGYESKTSVYITPRGDCLVDSEGHLVEDATIASRVTVRLRARRGEYYLDKNFGSRLHTIRTLQDAEREFLPMCEEALQPMLDAGEIVRLELGAFEAKQGPGAFLAELLIYVTEEEVLRIAGLPLGTWRTT